MKRSLGLVRERRLRPRRRLPRRARLVGLRPESAFEETVEAAEHLLRRRLDEVPGANGALDRLEQAILADALGAAENKAVVDLLLRPLHAVREEGNDMAGLRRVDPLAVRYPFLGLRRVAGARAWRSV